MSYWVRLFEGVLDLVVGRLIPGLNLGSGIDKDGRAGKRGSEFLLIQDRVLY